MGNPTNDTVFIVQYAYSVGLSTEQAHALIGGRKIKTVEIDGVTVIPHNEMVRGMAHADVKQEHDERMFRVAGIKG